MIATWACHETQGIDLQDKRLNDRLREVLSSLGAFPNESIPTAHDGGHAETTAAYRFFDNDKVSFEKILQPHIEATTQRLQESPVVIVAQDTTELDLTRPEQQVEGAGPLDGNARYGEFLHPTFAFTPDGTPLGLLMAEVWVRPEAKSQGDGKAKSQGDGKAKSQGDGKSDSKSKKRGHKQLPIEEKESLRWLDSLRETQAIAQEMPHTHFVAVADSEADIFELFEAGQEGPENFDWIIRACQNRAIVADETELPEEPAAEQEEVARYLRERLLQGEVLFTHTITIRGRQGPLISCDTRQRNQPRQSRTAALEVRAMEVTLRGPWHPGGKLPDTRVNAVLVTEIDPPPNDTPVEWLLLTSLPITTVEEVRQVIEYYCVRWMSEVFFRTLKSGCRVEGRRFETIERFERCLAVYMVVTWRTLYACRLGRALPNISCEAVFEPDEWKSVYYVVTHCPPPKESPRLQEMVRLVAQLGGYINRTRSDEPGPQTLCLGMQRMYDITRCWQLFGPRHRPKNQATCV